MARTMQTSRRSGANMHAEVVENPDVGEETAQKLKQIEEGSMQAQLKHIDRKYTEKGQVYYAEMLEEDIPDQVNWWSKFALCLVRYMQPGNQVVQKVSLQINSQHLKEVLKEVIGEFPGVSFQTKEITIDAPYRVLFHYRHELKQAGTTLVLEDAIAHHDLLLDFISREFEDTIEESENLLEQSMISYQHLWTIFRPGTTVYAPVFGQSRAFTLSSYAYTCNPATLQLQMEHVDFDGNDFGTRSTIRFIPAYTGAEKIVDLPAFPIQFHASPETLKKQLTERGRRWEQHAGMHFRSYEGIALEETDRGWSRYNIDGRVVVDTKTFHRLNANFAFSLNAFKSDEEKRAKLRRIKDDGETEETHDLISQDGLKLHPLTDSQCLLSNATVRGFSFSEKRWLDFFVDKLAQAGWNKNCFDQLVLTSTQKDLVQALVANHIEQRTDNFDDIVKGKGRGLILVLHGPPGVGKTLTAETVAEYTQRPLYTISSGDLGTEPSVLDTRLSRILDMARTWKAVLLIDEADIFLERRSLHDIHRNSLVSIFLRVLEYYEGILFLTSNRVSTFDDAFKSRIHVPLKYSNLTAVSRKKIWKNFLGQQGGGGGIDEGGYDSLAQVEINGRQIKNIIRTAKSLAQFHGEELDREKLEQVIRIQMEFEEELGGDGGKADCVNGVNGVVNGC